MSRFIAVAIFLAMPLALLMCSSSAEPELKDRVIAPEPDPDPVPEQAVPWFEEDWLAYSVATDMDFGGVNGWIIARMMSAYASDGVRDGDVGLETGLVDTPWGGSKAARVTFFDRSIIPCSELHGPEVGVRIEFPDADTDRPREIWYEVYVRFDTNWETVHCGFTPAPEHKFLMHYDQSFLRWNLMFGSNDQYHVRPYINDFTFSGATEINATFPLHSTNTVDARNGWDGEWHQVRGHLKMGNGDAVIELWWDGFKIFEQFGLRSEDAGNGYFKYVYLSSNQNHRPDRNMTLLFGLYRVFISDPKW